MSSSIVGYLWTGTGNPSSASSSYNNLFFEQVNGRWETTINGNVQAFDAHPSLVDSIPMDAGSTAILQQTNQAYLTFDPETEGVEQLDYIRFLFASGLEQKVGVFTASAVTSPSSTYDFPTITCTNATPSLPVLLLRNGNTTQITSQDNCIILEAETRNNYPLLVDRLLYGILGVIKTP